jgi:hypothetical protein
VRVAVTSTGSGSREACETLLALRAETATDSASRAEMPWDSAKRLAVPRSAATALSRELAKVHD